MSKNVLICFDRAWYTLIYFDIIWKLYSNLVRYEALPISKALCSISKLYQSHIDVLICVWFHIKTHIKTAIKTMWNAWLLARPYVWYGFDIVLVRFWYAISNYIKNGLIWFDMVLICVSNHIKAYQTHIKTHFDINAWYSFDTALICFDRSCTEPAAAKTWSAKPDPVPPWPQLAHSRRSPRSRR